MRTKAVLVAAFVCAIGTSAFGFEAYLTAVCVDGDVRVTVEVLNPTPPGVQFVGYEVVRDVLGVCGESVLVTESAVPFNEDIELMDVPALPDRANRYAVRARDSQGNLWGMSFGMWSAAVANCQNAPVFRGTVVPGIMGWSGGVLPCPDGCWLPEWYWPLQIGIGSSPAWLSEYVGTDVVFDFYGYIGEFIEGPFVSIENAVQTNCEATPTERQSWSNIKALFDGAPRASKGAR